MHSRYYSFLMVIDGFPFLLRELFPLLRKGILFYIHNQRGGQKRTWKYEKKIKYSCL